MRATGMLLLSLVPLFAWIATRPSPSPACCPAGPAGRRVVNADQTVIMIWDAERKMQHFIRQASFKSDARDVGFLVPTPSLPELEESGNEAFPQLAKATAPIVRQMRAPPEGFNCACAERQATFTAGGAVEDVQVLAEKRVAGFDAQVLQATSAESLVEWLNGHGYEFSPEVEKWAEPYVRDGWKITALKVAKPDEVVNGDSAAAADAKDAPAPGRLDASALRISFATDRPLFPYREPDPTEAARELNVARRLLRIYFVAEARYRGELTAESPWTGDVAWAGKLNGDQRRDLLQQLKLPESVGPAEFWLTEFEDYWPYRSAPADLYFSVDKNQLDVRRPDVIEYVRRGSSGDATVVLLFAAVVAPLAWRSWRRRGRFATIGTRES